MAKAQQLSSTRMSSVTPEAPDARAQYVAELRARYLAGTLDEVLIPEDAQVPDALMSALFPRLFPQAPLQH